MPDQLDGTEGHRAERVRVFADALTAAGFQVSDRDERYTTVEAEDILLEADVSRRRRKKLMDRVAAQRILQRWLDAKQEKAPTPAEAKSSNGP